MIFYTISALFQFYHGSQSTCLSNFRVSFISPALDSHRIHAIFLIYSKTRNVLAIFSYVHHKANLHTLLGFQNIIQLSYFMPTFSKPSVTNLLQISCLPDSNTNHPDILIAQYQCLMTGVLHKVAAISYQRSILH